MTSLRVSLRADSVELLLVTDSDRQINHSVMVRASDLRRRLAVRYRISISSLGTAWGSLGYNEGS